MVRHPFLVQGHVDPHVVEHPGLALHPPQAAALHKVRCEEAVLPPAVETARRIERYIEQGYGVLSDRDLAHAPVSKASTSAANSAWCWKRKP